MHVRGSANKIGYLFFNITRLLNYLRRKPLVLVIRGELKGGKIKPLEKSAFNNSNYIWLQSPCIAKKIKSSYELSSDKVWTIPNAINLSSYSKDWQPPPIKQPFRILFLGWLIKEKGVFELLDAFNTLSKHYNNIELIYLGDGTAKTILNDKINHYKLDDKVLLKGWVDEKKLEYIQNSHCVVLPTYKEGFSNTILEAMAVGRSIITTPVGANPDLILHEKNGYLVPIGDSDELSKYLEKQINDESICNHFGQENFKIVRKKYIIENIQKQFLNKITEIIN